MKSGHGGDNGGSELNATGRTCEQNGGAVVGRLSRAVGAFPLRIYVLLLYSSKMKFEESLSGGFFQVLFEILFEISPHSNLEHLLETLVAFLAVLIGSTVNNAKECVSDRVFRRKSLPALCLHFTRK